jgi:hypothetical protein
MPACIERTKPVYMGCGKVFASKQALKDSGCNDAAQVKQFIGDSIPNKDACAMPIGSGFKTCQQYVYASPADCQAQCGNCADITWSGY